jgi:nicotinamide-nucleotide amidase
MNPIHIILIGDELLSGKRQDQHLRALASDLEARGAKVTSCQVVRDIEGEVARCIAGCLAPGAIIVTTGGLGPTLDDLTREGVASATGVPLREEPLLWEALKRRFERAGRKISPSNRSQALVPETGTYFPNAHGTAPGLVFEPADYPDCRVLALPGPPRELIPMWREHALPYLADYYQWPPPPLMVLMRFAQMGESRIDERMRPMLLEHPAIELSSLIRLARVDVTLSLPVDHRDGREILREIAGQTREVFADYIYEYREYFEEERPLPLELEEVISRMLRNRKERLATAESCTGGQIAKWITDFPGSSDIFLGGVVSYDNNLKRHLLKVDEGTLQTEGAVSETVVQQMTEGVLSETGADWALATSGIAGPDGGTPEKPVGLVWIGVGNRSHVDVCRYEFPGDRESVREWAGVVALRHLWRRLSAEQGA